VQLSTETCRQKKLRQSFLPFWNNKREHEEHLSAGSAASVGKVSTAGDSEKMTKYLVSAGAITYSSWERSTEMGNSDPEALGINTGNHVKAI
jgi:hypothetical protein